MQTITNLSKDSKQKHTILLAENNEPIVLELSYLPTQAGWFMNLQYGDFVLNGIRVVTSTNLLRQWRNILPFGIMVETYELGEPMFIEDFATGRSSISILSSEEVAAIKTWEGTPNG